MSTPQIVPAHPTFGRTHNPKEDACCPLASYILETHTAMAGFFGCVTHRIFDWLQSAYEATGGLIGESVLLVYCAVRQLFAWGSAASGILSGLIGVATYKVTSTLTHALIAGATKTISWIKNNWKQVIAYVLAWSIVITFSGALYGFEAVALPLTIGLACGVGAGALVGLLMTTAIDPTDKWKGKNTAWDLLNMGIDKLDPNGTRQIVLAISVTVLLAAAVIFPHALGAVFGLLLGNQVVTKIGFGRNLGHDINDPKQQLRELRRDFKELQAKFEQIHHED